MGRANPILPRLLDPLLAIVGPIADRFDKADHRLYLVGGIVRDLFLASQPKNQTGSHGQVTIGDSHDVDLTTDADPATIRRLASPGADAVWTQGERFGTIGVRLNDHDLEITTHRAETYDPASRKPVVSFGRDLQEDLSRRDFTINAMAIDARDSALIDPFNGIEDLAQGVLRTPLDPEVSFDDDPLRILRAARFIARFNLTATPELVAAATDLAPRLRIVAVERQAVELERLLELPDPSPGFDFLQTTGVIVELVSEFEGLDPGSVSLACRLASVPGSPVARRVGLVWPTRSIAPLKRLRYSNTDQQTAERIVAALGSALSASGSENRISFDAPTARRIVASIGVENLPIVGEIARSVSDLDDFIDDDAADRMGVVFDQLRASEDLTDLGSPLSGSEIMAVLGIEPGPEIGRAERFLREHRLDHGPMAKDEAETLLRSEFS